MISVVHVVPFQDQMHDVSLHLPFIPGLRQHGRAFGGGVRVWSLERGPMHGTLQKNNPKKVDNISSRVLLGMLLFMTIGCCKETTWTELT